MHSYLDSDMKIREAFPAFTTLFQYCRPKLGDMIVYEVDAGTLTDPNLVIYAAEFTGETLIGETHELMISKEWVLDNINEILANVPDPETAGA